MAGASSLQHRDPHSGISAHQKKLKNGFNNHHSNVRGNEKDDHKPHEIHHNLGWLVIILTGAWLVWAFIICFLLVGIDLARSVFETACMFVALAAFIVPTAFLPQIEVLMRRSGANRWSDPVAWLLVLLLHGLVFFVWFSSLMQFTDLKLRWLAAYLMCTYHIKLQEGFNCISFSDESANNDAHTSSGTATTADSMLARQRARAIMKASPLVRASVMTWPPDLVSGLKPVDTFDKRVDFFQSCVFDFARFGALCSLIFFTAAYMHHELGVDLASRPLVLSLAHMFILYPALSLLLWPLKLTVWFLIGAVPSTEAGNWPIKSATMREFWGWRYNQVIGGMCKNTVFLPLVRCGWSPLAASFAVFAVTGALHAVPTALVDATLDQVLSQAAFFVVHWMVCAVESRFLSKHRSVMRTVVLFVLIYPLFGVSGVMSMTHEKVGFFVVMPRYWWDILKTEIIPLIF